MYTGQVASLQVASLQSLQRFALSFRNGMAQRTSARARCQRSRDADGDLPQRNVSNHIGDSHRPGRYGYE